MLIFLPRGSREAGTDGVQEVDMGAGFWVVPCGARGRTLWSLGSPPTWDFCDLWFYDYFSDKHVIVPMSETLFPRALITCYFWGGPEGRGAPSDGAALCFCIAQRRSTYSLPAHLRKLNEVLPLSAFPLCMTFACYGHISEVSTYLSCRHLNLLNLPLKFE